MLWRRFPSGLQIAKKYASAFPRPIGIAAKVIPKKPSLVRSPSGAAFQGGYKFASLPTYGASHGGEAAERKARRFSAKQARRKSAALFLPAPSILNRPCICFELRARADSPRFRGSLRGGLRSLLWCAVKVPRLSAAVLGLVRVDRVGRGKSAADERGGGAPYGLGALRLSYPRLSARRISPRASPPLPQSRSASRKARDGLRPSKPLRSEK